MSGASYDSLANYASLTTFGHIMVNSMTFARKHLSIAVRQIILPCARICFLSAPFYASSHTLVHRRENSYEVRKILLFARTGRTGNASNRTVSGKKADAHAEEIQLSAAEPPDRLS